MWPLAELQARVAHALVAGDAGAIDALAPALAGGANPRGRLAIHLRHYEASLTAALRDKYPATEWLVGPRAFDAAARAYVHAEPPRRPCIAEYGAGFPAFLAWCSAGAGAPYLQSFGALEHAVGKASIAVDAAPLGWNEIARAGPERLAGARVRLQPGGFYLRAAWRIDELMRAYLADAAPPTFVLAEADTPLEVRGARGEVSFAVIDAATFAFRSALANGCSIGDAAGSALDCDAAFDAGEALRRLAHAGLVTALRFED